MAEIKFYQDAAHNVQVYPEINPDGNYPGVTVGLADNLTSDEGIIDTDTWQYRTSGGELDISDGYATLQKITGTTESSTIEENLVTNVIPAGSLVVTTNSTTFKSQISTSGTYNFIYTPIITYSSTLVSVLNKSTFANAVSATTGTYTFNYAADVSYTDGAGVVTAFTKSTFVSKVSSTPGTYTFTYNGSNWQLNSGNVTLSQYGITTNGSEENGNTIVVSYAANRWYKGQDVVSMSGYGITTTGQEAVGDSIAINYTANQWQLNNTTVTLSNYGITITSGTPAIDNIIQVVYVAEQIGVIVTSNPQTLHSIGLNLFDIENTTQIFTGVKINSGGTWGTDTNYNVIYFKVTPETYTIEDLNGGALGYCAWSTNIPVVGTAYSSTLSWVSSSEWADSLENTTSKKHVTIENEGYLAATVPADMSQLCCHLTWEGVNDGVYESYEDYDFTIPYVDNNGTTIRTYGLVNLDDEEEYYDEIDFVNHKWYQRTDRIAYSAANLATVQALNVPYMYDNNYIYYGIDTITYNLSDTSSDYKVSNYGTEELIDTNKMECNVSIFYQDNLKDKLRFSAEVIDNKVDKIDKNSTYTQYASARAAYNMMYALRRVMNLYGETFSATKTYSVGEWVMHDWKLWRCQTAVTSAGAWTGNGITMDDNGSGIVLDFDSYRLRNLFDTDYTCNGVMLTAADNGSYGLTITYSGRGTSDTYNYTDANTLLLNTGIYVSDKKGTATFTVSGTGNWVETAIFSWFA